MKIVQAFDAATGRVVTAQLDDSVNKTAEEQRSLRIQQYKKYWQYYKGEQYDKDNLAIRASLGLSPDKRIPEHLRLHSYTGVIEEGVDFITDQLVENLNIEVKSNAEIASGEPADEPPLEQQIFLNIWEQSDMDLNAPDLTRESLVSAESYILLRWDEAEQIVRMVPYDAESVEPEYSQDNYKKMIRCTIHQIKYVPELDRNVDYREIYAIGQTSEGFVECIYLKYNDIDDDPIETRLLNIPFIPIVHLITIKKRVRESFGESLVERLVGDADRYNSVNGLEYQIARYNSISHLAIFGEDTARVKGENLNLGGEATDFWAFPASTDVKPVTLPADITMISSQKETVENHMYRKMGLQRMDIQDFKGIGAPSGYALEIINRKTDGVFTRIQKELTKGYVEVFDKTMDMQAIMESGKPWYKTDPKKTYPNRTVIFTFGSLFVADKNEIRSDFVAGLVSQKKSLMLMGYSETEALEIMDQCQEEKEAAGALEMEGMAGLIKNAKKTESEEESEEPEE